MSKSIALALPAVPVNDNTERIFHEAWLMFQELGYRGASIDELCQRCGLTKPTLYYYFGNKERLFIQVMVRQLQGYRAILQSTDPLVARLEVLAGADTFDWYAEDFERPFRGARSLAAFLALYRDALDMDESASTRLTSGAIDLEFLDYDWSLNRKR